MGQTISGDRCFEVSNQLQRQWGNLMTKWLAPLKRNNGLMGLAHQDMREVITQGVDIIMRYRNNPMMPQYVYGGPQEGVPIIRDDQSLELFLAGLVAASVRNGRWGAQRFYYPCAEVPKIIYTAAWRAMLTGFARHDVAPLLTYEKDVHQFDRTDWLLCTVNIVLI